MQKIIRWIEEVALAMDGDADSPQVMADVKLMREMANNMHSMNARQFQEVMTTAHFTDYFSDALSRMFYKDYAYKAGTWKEYTTADVTPDFRDVKRYRMTEPGTLLQRREKALHKATSIDDSVINYGVEEYSREFDISWRVIMNDDLGKIRETPRRMANAAGRWLDAWVSALYDNATTQATAAALGAPWSGTGRLTAPNLALGLNGMMQRVDAAGNPMNLPRVHLVIPPILQIQAADILQDLLSYGGPGGNVLAQFVAGVHIDPYITTTALATPWYLFADPADMTVVPVVRLDGWPGPVTSMKRSDLKILSGTAPSAFTMGSFATGDITYMVEDIIGGWDDASWVGVVDFRGFYYSSGTTP